MDVTRKGSARRDSSKYLEKGKERRASQCSQKDQSSEPAGGEQRAAEEDAALKIQRLFRGKKAKQSIDNSSAIIVGVRMRPLVPHEKGQTACFKLEDKAVYVVPQPGMEEKAKKLGPWKFDFAMDSSDKTKDDFVSNDKCYQLMGRNMVDHALAGFNTCLFCYGQTGTGKTTTIYGDPENGEGLLYRMLEDIFIETQKLRAEGATVELEVNMVEVYNEGLFDLLIKKGTPPKKVDLMVLPSGVSMKGAESRIVTAADECKKIIESGQGNRHVAATQMNPQSSRGHTVFKLTLKKSGGPDGKVMNSEIYLADLAGHENIKTTQVTGDRLQELTNINSSLMALTQALKAMASMKPGKKVDFHIFRGSKLTLLLSPALTGNSRTNVIITLSPALSHMDTTLDALEIGKQAKYIKITAKAHVSNDPKKVINKLEHEVASLKKKLAAARKGNGAPPSMSDEVMEEKFEQIKDLESANKALEMENAELKRELSIVKRMLSGQRRESFDRLVQEVAQGDGLHNGSTVDSYTLHLIASQVNRVSAVSNKNRELLNELVKLVDIKIPSPEVSPMTSPNPKKRTLNARTAGLMLVTSMRLAGHSLLEGAGNPSDIHEP